MTRYTAVLCAIARNEGPYIREWLAHHQAIGFDRIVVYDNESSDGGCEDLKKSKSQHFEIREWPTSPEQPPQHGAYFDFFADYKDKSEWILYLDLDEFLNLKIHDDIASFLHELQFADAIQINWRIFGSSGHLKQNHSFVVDRFQMAARADCPSNGLVKTIFRPALVTQAGVHSPLFRDGAKVVSPSGRALPADGSSVQPMIELEIAQINHYFTKSQEEFLQKRLRGRGDIADGNPDKYRAEEAFASMDRNEEHDPSILRFRERLMAAYEAIGGRPNSIGKDHC